MKLSTTIRLNKQDLQYSPDGLTLRLNSISYRKLFLALAYHVERYGDKVIELREATDEQVKEDTLWKLDKDDLFYIITVGQDVDHNFGTE